MTASAFPTTKVRVQIMCSHSMCGQSDHVQRLEKNHLSRTLTFSLPGCRTPGWLAAPAKRSVAAKKSFVHGHDCPARQGVGGSINGSGNLIPKVVEPTTQLAAPAQLGGKKQRGPPNTATTRMFCFTRVNMTTLQDRSTSLEVRTFYPPQLKKSSSPFRLACCSASARFW